uniref:Putative ubiquitin domain of gaba-receptor-associated protein n=1 Tax=Ixodes ricinus TaxID=34613 RepID=A0A131YA53_IXORI
MRKARSSQEDGIRFRFKSENSPEQRKQEADAILEKYPHRIPVIVERAPNSHVPSIDKQKFLVPSDITVAQFMWIVRKRIHLSPEKALFVFVGRLMPQSSLSMGDLYGTYRDEDGFLYLAYSGENTFGTTVHLPADGVVALSTQ